MQAKHNATLVVEEVGSILQQIQAIKQMVLNQQQVHSVELNRQSIPDS